MNYEDKCNAVIKDVIKLAQGGATPAADDYDLAVAWDVFDGEEVTRDNGDSNCLPFTAFTVLATKAICKKLPTSSGG